MLPYLLSEITSETLESICTQRFSESETLDFKRELPSNEERSKVELAKDVAAMANTGGGDIVYGIEELDGAAATVCVIKEESFDEAERRIRQILDAKVEPRLTGYTVKEVRTGEGYALLIRVPYSFDGPHCVRTDSQRRFTHRNGTLTTDMSFDQIRAAFAGTESITSKARRFIKDRYEVTSHRRHTIPLFNGAHLAVVFVPLASMMRRNTIDIQAIRDGQLVFWDSGANIRFSIDGKIEYSGTPGLTHQQTLLFRNGAVECTCVVGNPTSAETKGIWSAEVTNRISRSLDVFKVVCENFDVTGPALIGCYIAHTTGRVIDRAPDYSLPLTQDSLELQEFFIENVAGEWGEKEIVNECEEILYQAFGFRGAPTPTGTRGR
ncbi:AlbA family DNA-binding domain-containing protein [Paracidovorax avenae]|uniref:AlbA family DNA-binding domain-containing protein n=1 Tax=Paracidovorax avenae TaxID=80867 RepID=UPI000D213B5F|nr:ATP-binding protein [Paracidovorax avenae]AVT13301.1 hypothetical protein C8235_10710 [Paracidovorax avenae]